MAILTQAQFAKLRKVSRRNYDWGEVDFTKIDINAAFQAMEDWYQANKAAAANAIDTATQPEYTFSNEQKKVIAAAYFALRFDLDSGG